MENYDILKNLESENIQEVLENNNINFKYETIVTQYKKANKLLSTAIFMLKYAATTTGIFIVLLLSTNYSAYYTIAKSYVMKEQVEIARQWLIDSVNAAQITKVVTENIEEKEDKNNLNLSLSKYKKELDSNSIKLDIDITTIENRIIIPKIGRNIPLLDIKNRSISGQTELNDIFMEELENWVIRYPGSARPGEEWLSFIFWHSSNFPWLKWNYNEVFATLDRVMIWDEVIIYYNQKKFTFKITERAIIKPGDVWILKRNKKISEIAIMTCWPIGTTLNRFIVIWELIES